VDREKVGTILDNSELSKKKRTKYEKRVSGLLGWERENKGKEGIDILLKTSDK